MAHTKNKNLSFSKLLIKINEPLARSVSSSPEVETTAEKKALENAKLREEVKSGRIENTDKGATVVLRGLACLGVGVLMWWWLCEVLSLVRDSATIGSNVYISDNVLIALLSSTTVNVIGLAYIVLRNLFPKK